MVATADILTDEQIEQLETAYNVAIERDQDAEGAWADVYHALYEFLTTTVVDFGFLGGFIDTPRRDVPVDPHTWLWLKGARFVNANEGAFGALIREYTIAQYTQRYGTPPTDALMNRASNNIAKSFIGQWIGRNGNPQIDNTQPTLEETGLYDAGAAASTVFGSEGGTGDPDNAAGWAGAILFPNLGAPEFYQNLILRALEGPDATGSFPSKNAALPGLIGIDQGSYDVIAAAAAIETFARPWSANIPTMGEEWNAIFRQFSNFGTVAELQFEADAKFWAFYGLGLDDPRPEIGHDTLGTTGTQTVFTFNKDAHYVVGTKFGDHIGLTENDAGAYVTDAGVLGWVTGTGDVLNAGRGDDTVYGSTGLDILDGGEGWDTMSYADFGAVTVTFKQKDSIAPFVAEVSKGVFNGFFSGRDLLYNFEKIIGSDEGDTIHGDVSHLPEGFEFEVGAGNDTIDITGGGARVILGGTGRDYIRITAVGSVIYGDTVDGVGAPDSSENADKIVFAPGVTLMDAGKYDILVLPNGQRLTGGVANGQRANGSAIYNDKLAFGISYKQVGADLHIYDRFGAWLDQLDGKPVRGDFVVRNFDVANAASGWGFAQWWIAQDSKLGLSFKHDSPLDRALKVTFGLLGTTLLTAPAYYALVGMSLIDAMLSSAAAQVLNLKSLAWALGADPLVIDLDGDGIETIALTDSSVYFDMDGDLFAERTGWLKGDDGFLVLDANGNGRIDDIGEMFGGVGASGFAELATLDSDGDGRITAADAVWAELRVWQDKDRDGVTDDGELKSLDALGIVSLDVTARPLDATTPQGARLTGYGDVTFAGGTVRRMFDAVLAANETDTKYAGESGLASWQQDLTLDAKGFGRITDLSVAMANDVALGELAASTAAAMTAPNLRTLVAQAGDVLGAWGAALELIGLPAEPYTNERRTFEEGQSIQNSMRHPKSATPMAEMTTITPSLRSQRARSSRSGSGMISSCNQSRISGPIGSSFVNGRDYPERVENCLRARRRAVPCLSARRALARANECLTGAADARDLFFTRETA